MGQQLTEPAARAPSTGKISFCSVSVDTNLFKTVPVSVAVCLSVCLSVSLVSIQSVYRNPSPTSLSEPPSLSGSFSLSVCLSVCLSVSRSLFVSVCLSLPRRARSLSLALSLSLSLSLALSVCLCLYICLCLSVCVCARLCLSVLSLSLALI